MSRRQKFLPVWDGGSFVGGAIENGRVMGARFERRIVGLAHWCPGCKKIHVLHKGEFEFSGEPETPTVRPAVIFPIVVNPSSGQRAQQFHCVYTITDGTIYFGRECTHALAGHTVDMPDWSVADAQRRTNLPDIPGARIA